MAKYRAPNLRDASSSLVTSTSLLFTTFGRCLSRAIPIWAFTAGTVVGVDHWTGLVEWLRARLLGPGRVDPTDVALLHMTDDPEEVCDIVTHGHAAQLAILESRHGPLTR